ncbi:Phosphatidylserine decarboxylase proenzyme 3 {ECO:0000303/PubMed:19286980} {ECO:0000255/HAMAP-Rule:MF_03209}; Contains: RecName: Full=Phosphatidylserine decarboxylase 3 beta chain {ECO:0000305}; Contains: RecName: Full=Phosphatidylserine decarboxylase 3 alpha chain {ECO:0000305} [Serendipita indica DSM 11827]|uniref:Phosphatidylserine decarboxylase proenzyme 2 n=1 Tax=Serendipita indica (strain DSM 11827) TaxID=1109443 RepID=G4U3D6_SERID|nr:Phosphatidylserine decarboxylase proenzyme 3 {ECO:0000303/PubMed:19286980} {ECO:0000255/HAMAP-Rule:MF_03209}; Contains: RecName: Full=Phosphatidylserine decarboxylase 3 beta chain {ECO:0000305}; Contains: RecName: Full=Phosphatidylserine decarboxylase 3 alpha chain {ECO:0000305} [Serendipita indica DSM 11827]CCA78094.1 related to phosphatidylserine decarboxylase [Serendipita indica DSM 11827]
MAPTNSTTKKGIRIGSALKSGASKVIPGKRFARPIATVTTPAPGEQPVFILKVQIVGCNGLPGVDRSGKSDPYVTVRLLQKQFQTPAITANLDPEFPAAQSTFEFPVFASLIEALGALELIVWDKNIVMKKEYLGEVAIPIGEWFAGTALTFDDPNNTPIVRPLLSTKASRPAMGSIRIKLGLVPVNPQMPDVKQPYQEMVRRSQDAAVTLQSAPPTEGIGTVRSDDGHDLEDDGMTDDETEDEFDSDQPSAAEVIQAVAPVGAVSVAPATPQVAVKAPEIVAPIPEPISSRPGLLPRLFSTSSRRGLTQPQQPAEESTSTSAPSSRPSTPGKSKRPKFRRGRSDKGSTYNFGGEKDVLGIVLLEVNKAEDLPKLKNMTRTGWDMDPFVVISFSKKVFRTRVLRHNLNPVWDEKLLFHVRRFEANYNIQLTVLDWDKLSGNDLIADTTLNVAELIQAAPKPDPTTGLYADLQKDTEMMPFSLTLNVNKEAVGDGSHKPTISFKAKYQPYDLLRQRFWANYLKQYDTDDTGAFSHLEITAMLDSLGSTLSRETLNSWFTRSGRDPVREELTLAEVIQYLEEETSRPDSQKKKLSGSQDESLSAAPSGIATPSMLKSLQSEPLNFEKIDFTGEDFRRSPSREDFPEANPNEPSGNTNVLGSMPVPAGPQLKNKRNSLPTRADIPSVVTTEAETPSRQQSQSDEDDSGSGLEDRVERVINVKTCPLCHRPRLNNKGEMDIITHLAVCASQDWEKVDRITVGNFVTASQAQRKWYTKAIAKLSTGAYSIGANSANVIVQNRMTGQLEEEKMQGFVRIGIRLLYKGARSRMEGAQARRLLKSMSIKEGVKFNNPESAKGIRAFIEFHNLNVDEILDPIDSFPNFNEFFYRKLKPEARPVSDPDDPRTIVSSADCRLMAFESVGEATRIWIKGREFTVGRLLGERYKDEIHKYEGGALVIFRLAPQDYHRFHSPVDGKIGPMTYISGEYYTVNPQAIRTQLDVYGENARKIVPIDSPVFGRVFCACIGAMMVGTIVTTVNEGEEVKRGQEFGYFAFGGSTIVTIFPKGTAVWDQDLLDNSKAPLETLVRVGMRIGRKAD